MSIYKTQDIHIDDLSLKTEYYRKFLNGSVDDAQDIYDSNPSLQGKCVNAELLNQLLNSIISIENEFNTDVYEFLNNQLDIYQININDLIYMQEWDNTTQYEINNFVLYNSYIYFCYMKPPTGTEPTDTDYWIELNTQGVQGYIWLGITYKGSWNNLTSYNQGNMVVYQNELYVAKSTNVGMLPTNTTYWLKVATIEPKIIFVSDTEPANIATGDVWFKII